MDFWNILTELNKFSNLVLALLTLLLLCATGFYAWVSYRLLKETVEMRRSAVRPLLWIDTAPTPFQHADGTHRCIVHPKWNVGNYGRGLALDLGITVPVIDGFGLEIVTSKGYERLEPLSKGELEFHLVGDIEPKDAEECSMKIEVSFFDVEGNYYELRQSIIGAYRQQFSDIFWVPTTETLLVMPLLERSEIYPQRARLVQLDPDPMAKAHILYRRVKSSFAQSSRRGNL